MESGRLCSEASRKLTTVGTLGLLMEHLLCIRPWAAHRSVALVPAFEEVRRGCTQDSSTQ